MLGAGASLAAASACSGGNLASNLVDAPEFDPKGQTKCNMVKR